MLDKMKELVRRKDTCVLATAAGGRPHCSLMAYVPDEDCRELYMVTLKDSRKYRNLIENPRVSLLIDNREDHPAAKNLRGKALTVSGTYLQIRDESKYESVRHKLLAKHPGLSQFLNQPETEILCIKITSFLLLDGLTEAYFEEVG